MTLPAKTAAAKTATANGIRIAYDEDGSPSAPPLVLVPGQSMSRDSYQRVLPLLRQRYHVFAVDVRGHGGSARTPGAYTFANCGRDCVAFIKEVVGRPAFLSGNSSGGIIALCAAANAPDLVRGVLAEDPPIFTSEWPRMRDDLWALKHVFAPVVRHLDKEPRDIAAFFDGFTIPVQGREKVMSFPRPIAWVLGGAIRRRQRASRDGVVDIGWLPLHLRLFVRGLSTYDVGFTRACVDGTMCDVDQTQMMSGVRCPVTLMHAAWFRHPTLGIVGACSDDDVKRAQSLCPQLVVDRVHKPHIVHLAAPRRFCAAVDSVVTAAAADDDDDRSAAANRAGAGVAPGHTA